MNDSTNIISIKGGISSITKISDMLYDVVDGEGNKITLTESQLRSLPNIEVDMNKVVQPGQRLILGNNNPSLPGQQVICG